MGSSGDWVGVWCLLAAASYFLLFSFSAPSFWLVPLFSSPGPPHAAVPSGYPCSSVGHPWAAAPPDTQCPPPRTIFSPIPHNVPFHTPSPASAFVPPLVHPHISSRVFAFRSHVPTFPPRETGTPLPGHFSIKLKLPLRITLQLAESLPSSYPGCCCLSAELPAFTRVTPAPCISTKCHFKESKTKEVCCVGSDHQVQLIRSFPHRLPTKVLQPRDPFHAETAEKVFSQPGWCSILPPCLSSPSPPNIQAASKAVDGHIPQHSFPKSESTSTNWSSFNSTVDERLHIQLSAIQMHPQTFTASETHLFLII